MEISRYSSRRPSISSLSSISRTTSVCEDIPQTLSRGVSLSESLKSPDSTSPKSPDMDLSVEADNFAAKLQQKIKARGSGPPRNGPRNQPGGRGAGRRRENSGSKDQGRRPQGNQEGPRRPQNRGNQEANRKRTDSGSAQKNSDGQKESSGENQRPPRREGRGRGGSRGVINKPEHPGPKVSQSKQKARRLKVEAETTKRRAPRNKGTSLEGISTAGARGTTGPRAVIALRKLRGKKGKLQKPPSLKITDLKSPRMDQRALTSRSSTPASSPGKDCGSSEPVEKKVIPSEPLTNGNANGDDNAAEVNHHEETSTSSTEAKKIIEREKMESAVKESVVMVNGDSKVEGEIKGKDCEEDGGEK
ncbi:hypothetical protein BSL78_27339 [Apostichopus japonicus]|uniref:Uncharacterized protein n=1 Tax=Stichopus japonicus TaxID=307972 RepID=A0A2G8JJE5_STIJA|nr:hypothetical protein BSL78_27339 [Apostichopus japonicus]